MKTQSHNLTRRQALLSALQGTVAASLVMPLITANAELPAVSELEFVPENDYPYFGWEPEPLV